MGRYHSLKTKKSAAKRFKITATGKVTYRSPGKRHLLGHKSSKRKRLASGVHVLSETHAHHIKNCLPHNRRG